MALSSKDPRTDQLAREGLERPRPARLADELDTIARRVAALPVLDPRASDEILGYDERGLPN